MRVLRKYGEETVIDFPLYATDGGDLVTNAVHASGDTTVMKDGGSPANTSNGFVDEGDTYSIILTATEMEAARVVLKVADQGTKAWMDTVLVIETFGHASAMFPDNYAEIASAFFDEDIASHAASGSFGEWVNENFRHGVIRYGLIAATPSSFDVVQLDAGASAGTHRYQECILSIVSASGTFKGSRPITAYNGTTKEATVASAFTNDVVAGDKYVITPFVPTNLGRWLSSVPASLNFFGFVQSVIDPNNVVTALWTNLGVTFGTAVGPGASTNTLEVEHSVITGQGDSWFEDALISIIAGTGKGQNNIILSASSTTDEFTLLADWEVAPDNTSVFAVYKN